MKNFTQFTRGASIASVLVAIASFIFLFPSEDHGIPITDNTDAPVYEGLTLKEINELPKYDRPDLAVAQNFDMTRDPALDAVPVERSLEAFDQKNRSKFARFSDIAWQERGPNNVGGRTRAIMFDPNDGTGTKVWAAGVAGGLWFNTNITLSSTTWQNVDDFWANLAITTIAYDPSNTQNFYVGTGEGFFNADAVRGAGLWKSTDGGTTWNQLSSTANSDFYYVQKVVVTPTGAVIAATRSGLFRSTNGGSSWSQLFSGRYADIEVASNGDVYASEGIFSTGVVRKSTNDGVSWSTVTPATGGERIELAVAPSNSNVVYAVASNNTAIAWIRKTTNGGSSWSTIPIPAYTEQSCNLSSTNDFARGQAWYDLIMAVHPTNPDIALIGGIDIYRTTNGGSSWGLVSYWTGACDAFVHADQHAMAFSPTNNNAAIFGNDGGVYYSSNIGNASNPSFAARNNGYNVTQFYGADQVNTAGSNFMIAGAQDNGSQRFNGAGINSTVEVSGGDGAFCHIDQQNSTYQFTQFVFNSFFRSTNGGSSFSSILQNQIFGRFINPTDYDDDAKVMYSAANEDQYIYLNNLTGTFGAFISNVDLDGFQASAIKVSPYTNNRIFIGTGTSGASGGSAVFRIDNAASGSATSTRISTATLPGNGYISSIDIGTSDNQVIITYSNYGLTSVWETRNGGSTWSNREGNLPDIPIRWALYDPNNTDRVLLATELGVWSTENINVSSPAWTVTNAGLANVRCDQLQIRSSDGIVLVATHGRGVYTADAFATSSGGDTQAPTTPTSLSASSITTSGFQINWVASSDNVGVTGYNVYLNGSLNGTTTSTSYSFNGLVASTTYNVAVEATDAAGNTSTQSMTSATTSSAGLSCASTISSFTYTESFEGGSGTWLQALGDDGDWVNFSGSTPSSGTGPTSASEGSSYFYLEASTNNTAGEIGPNATAILNSPCFDLSGESQVDITFDYHMNGNNVGSLALESTTDNVNWVTEWSISGNQGASWNTVSVSLNSFTGGTVKLRVVGTTGGGWSSDIAIDNVSVTTGSGGGSTDCNAVEFGTVSLYGVNQDISGDFQIQDAGATLFLENNTWKSIAFNYEVAANTYISFDFRSTSQGEIHGIGFDSDNNISSNRTFKVYGSQSWGISNYDNYKGSSWVTYDIPVGSFYTGSFDRLFFVNDNDASSGNNSYFRNVTIHEGECLTTLANTTLNDFESLAPVVNNEGEFDFTVFPNPAQHTLNVLHTNEKADYSILSISGKVILNGHSEESGRFLIDVDGLKEGIYFLRLHTETGYEIMKFRKE